MAKFTDAHGGFAGVTAGHLRQAHQRDLARLARPAGGHGVLPAAGAIDGRGTASRPGPPGRISSAGSWLSFPRIIDVPFEICVAALQSWQRAGQDGELHLGQSLLRWPIEHGPDRGTCQIEAGLARGPLRSPLRMRLDIDRWSPSSARTALELIPCQRVRPTAAYFRSGHLLLDSLTCALRQAGPGDEPGTPATSGISPRSREASSPHVIASRFEEARIAAVLVGRSGFDDCERGHADQVARAT
jgi:hypothetical protein